MLDDPLVAAIRAELEAAGMLDSMIGQHALVLGARMAGSETLAGIAALSRELRAVMGAAVGSQPAVGGDLIDELRARRDAKRSS